MKCGFFIIFFLNRGNVVSKDHLMEYLWENKLYVDENILNVNLSRLRKRLAGIRGEELNFNRTEKGVHGGWQTGGIGWASFDFL